MPHFHYVHGGSIHPADTLTWSPLLRGLGSIPLPEVSDQQAHEVILRRLDPTSGFAPHYHDMYDSLDLLGVDSERQQFVMCVVGTRDNDLRQFPTQLILRGGTEYAALQAFLTDRVALPAELTHARIPGLIDQEWPDPEGYFFSDLAGDDFDLRDRLTMATHLIHTADDGTVTALEAQGLQKVLTSTARWVEQLQATTADHR